MFIDSGKVTATLGKEPPVITTREEWKKLIAQGWRRTKGRSDKKKVGLLILNRWSNNYQSQSNVAESSMRFILFESFLPNLKSIYLAFLLNNSA